MLSMQKPRAKDWALINKTDSQIFFLCTILSSFSKIHTPLTRLASTSTCSSKLGDKDAMQINLIFARVKHDMLLKVSTPGWLSNM